jgi:hypothetical protein
VPFGGRFAGEVDDQQLQHTRFFANKDKITALQAELLALAKSGQGDKVRKLVEDNTNVGLYKKAEAIYAEVSKLNQAANDNIDKPELLKSLDTVRTEYMRSLNDSVLALEKASDKKAKAKSMITAPEPEEVQE